MNKSDHPTAEPELCECNHEKLAVKAIAEMATYQTDRVKARIAEKALRQIAGIGESNGNL